MRYDFEGSTKVHVLDSQTEMLQRLYPEYDGSQYCLWIVPDLFDKYSHAYVNCDVNLVLKSGETLSLPGKKVIRTPYPNKNIWQHGVKTGRKCIFGVPLLFDSYEALSEISEIHCTWNVGRLMYVEGSDKAIGSLLMALYSRFLNVSFEEKPGCKCYTLAVYDSFYDENNTDLVNEGYDFMCYGSGWLEFHDSEFEPEYDEDTFEMFDIDCHNINGVHEERELTDEENDIFNVVEGLSLEPFYDEFREKVFPIVGSDSIDYVKYYYVKSGKVIEAADYFDIIPESSFGFKSLRDVAKKNK